MAIVCVIANFFFIDQNDLIIVHYNKFTNLGVFRTNFPDLKGPRIPSQNCKKFLLKEFFEEVDFDKYSRQQKA